MLSTCFGVELLAALPFEHDITAAGTRIGSAQQLPPTVSAQWLPPANEAFHPYVDVGLNYTTFFDEEFNATGKAATGANELNLTDSLGLALDAGVDVKVTDRVIVSLAVWKADIDTDVEADDVKIGEVELDPFAAMLGIGLRF